MDWNIESLKLFIIFFVPGFIALKVFDLLNPNKPRDFSKSFYDAIVYSSINCALLIWPIYNRIFFKPYYIGHKCKYFAWLFFIIFIAPIIWSILWNWLINRRLLKKYFGHPAPMPWDFAFDQKSSWVIVKLKSGKKIGGIFEKNSGASFYPEKEQIYLEQVWEIDENEGFIRPIERTGGILILGDEISTVEFYKDEKGGDKNDRRKEKWWQQWFNKATRKIRDYKKR